MRLQSHHLELLSPARDAAIAREAILHGADAVYIGGPGFGARHNASNSLSDIVLELDIPPIELHASTQCDIRTVEKAKFLSDAGFSQIVLARELNLNQIRDSRQSLQGETFDVDAS
jgi:putative protease